MLAPRHRVHVESLNNAAFAAGTDGWSVNVYGTQPTIEIDPPHDGRPALRISSNEPFDAALGQELLLSPGRWYRLRGSKKSTAPTQS